MAGVAATLALGLQFVAAATADLAAGIQPVIAGEPGEPAVTMALTPAAGIVDDTRGAIFSGIYSPRAFWRHPYGLGVLRPALLHSLQLSYNPLPEGRTRFGISSNATMGELDYTAVQSVFGEEQSVAPSDPFIDVLTASVSLSLRHAINRRLTLNTSLNSSYQETSFGAGVEPFSSYDVRLGPSLAYRLTRRDSLIVSVGSQLAFFETSDQLSVELTAGYSRVVSRRYQFTMSAGAGRIEQFSNDGQDQDQVIGALRLTEPLYYGLGAFTAARARENGSDSLSMGLEARVDPLLQQIRPQASVSLSSTERLDRRVVLGANAAAFSVVFAEPLEFEPSETGVNATGYVDFQFADFTLGTGVRLGFRAPHLEQAFEFRETQAVGFLRVSWSSEN